MTFIFTFSINPETQEAAYAGNISIPQALQYLQQLAIADAVNKAKEAEKTGQGKQEDVKIEEEK